MTDKNNFINSVKFKEDFLPFKGGDEIKFGGETEIQNLIKFYLKNKKVENWKKNGERFKINCVLGNNGGGKSRLFEGILEKNESIHIIIGGKIYKRQGKEGVTSDITLNISGKKIKLSLEGTEKSICFDKIFFLLDDFFKLSGNIQESVNKSILSKGGTNKFYYEAFNFLLNNNKKLFSNFLNLSDNFNTRIGINGIRFAIDLELEKGVDKFIIIRNLFDDYKELFTLLKGKEGMLFDNTKVKILDVFYLNIYKEYSNIVLELLEEYFNFLGSVDKNNKEALSGIGDDIMNFQGDYFNNLTRINIYFIKNSDNFELVEDITKIYDKLTEYLLDFENSDDVISNNYEESIIKYRKLKKSHSIFFNKMINISAIKLQFYAFELKEIKILKKYFNLDLQFTDGDITKTFNNLSAGEKMMLTRFTNIYMKISEEFEDFKKKKPKKDFEIVILIDEPDLHLHLEWQKKYIQKLIDVFSTLDTNIKLHFIIATHSPFIISDLPTESIVVLDGSEKNKYQGKYTEVINNYEKEYGRKTFGANFVDIIRDGFFFKDEVLMGGFSESVIGCIAQERREEITNNKEIQNIEQVTEIEKNIGDEFLRANLLYFKGTNE